MAPSPLHNSKEPKAKILPHPSSPITTIHHHPTLTTQHPTATTQ